MRKTWLAVAVAITVGTMLQASVWAQGPGGGGGRMGGRRNSPKSRLSGLMRGIGELEKGKKAALTKDQARKVVAAVRPWQSRPRMSEGEAKSLYMKVNAVLTTRQKNELDKMSAQNRRFGGGGGGRMGGPGGGGRMGGGPGGSPPSAAQMQQMRQRMQRMQGFFKTYNPFYPPSKYKELSNMPDRMRQGQTRRYQEQQALIAQLAKKAR